MRLLRSAGWRWTMGVAWALIVAQALAQPRGRPAPADDDTPPPQGVSRGENFSLKPPAQLFAADCTGAGCHRGPQGLAKGQSAFGLTNFLRQHYTNSSQSAASLAAYLAGIPGAAAPTRRQPEPKSRASAEPPDGTAKPKTPAAAAKPPQRGKQATVEPPKPATPPPAITTETPAAPPPPAAPGPAPAPPPKTFDIFD